MTTALNLDELMRICDEAFRDPRLGPILHEITKARREAGCVFGLQPECHCDVCEVDMAEIRNKLRGHV